jgi:hypothetical protein
MAASSALRPDEVAEPIAGSGLRPGEVAEPISDAMAGSVMAPPEGTGQTVKRYGRTIGKVAAGMTPPVVGSAIGGAVGAGGAAALGQPELAPEAGALGRTVGGAIGGALSPTAEYGAAKAMGENVVPPTVHDALKSAAWNLGMGALGEVGTIVGGGKAAAVAPEMGQLPKKALTVANLRQAVRNRDFLKQVGMKDEEIDQLIKSPDLQEQFVRSVQGAKETKAAYQTVLDSTRKDFKERYDAAYSIAQGPSSKTTITINGVTKTIKTGTSKSLLGVPVEVAPLGQAMEENLKLGERELTPSFAGYLKRKAGELSASAKKPVDQMSDWEAVAAVHGTKEANRLAKGSVQALAGQAKVARALLQQSGQGLGAPLVSPEVKQYTIQDLRDLKTELRENLPGQPTPLDRKLYQQFNDEITKLHDMKMTEAGAKPEQIAAVHAVDDEYGKFAETIKKIDPRSEKFGAEVANEMFDPMLKSPEHGMNFIRLAQAAERANPGQVMPQLRAAFINKAASEAVVGNAPMEEMRVLQKLYGQWNGDQGTRAVLKTMFGADSPMSDPVTFSRVLAAPAKPEQVNRLGSWMQRAVASPYLARAAALTAAGGSMFSIYQHPEHAPAIAAALLSLYVGGTIIGKLDPIGQRAYINFKLNPNPVAFRRFMQLSGAMIGATSAIPDSDQSRLP